ncbi:MAG: PrsW family intramembrane metalloprotease [Flavobacteriaceae bacterium]|nr:PrsW family intramembrane metalloprotease [Flavobacteriaceae bacterium]
MTLLILALSPGLAIILYFYLKDIHEPEPFGQLAISFLYGIISMLIATGIIYLIFKEIHFDSESFTDMAIKAFLIIGVIEEGSKFLFIRGILYKNDNFNEPFDGIIYSVMVGMGFALTENIFYVINGDGGTAILRMFTAVPAHALFAVIMGFFLGEAKLDHKHTGLHSFAAIALAIVAHGVYDYFLFISFVPGLWIGAVVSLIIGVLLSHWAIKIHQDASPFRKDDSETSE